jgi:hypothetical protein
MNAIVPVDYIPTGMRITKQERDHIVVQDGDVEMSIRFGSPYRRTPKTRVYIDGDLITRTDATYADLEAQEENLGDRRWATKGQHPDVDTLYNRLNRRYATVSRTLATAALTRLGGKFAAAADGLKFSRNAGCTTCTCSPGNIASEVILINGRPVETIWFSVVKQPALTA